MHNCSLQRVSLYHTPWQTSRACSATGSAVRADAHSDAANWPPVHRLYTATCSRQTTAGWAFADLRR
jgi:hypothetical protein